MHGRALIAMLGALLLPFIGCGDLYLTPIKPPKIQNAADAKQRAREIAGQKCRYYGSKDLGGADYGAQQFYCERGMYTLELGQSHLFEKQFYSFKADDEVRFRYSDKLLMKPQYIGEARPQDANPAFYLLAIN